MTPEAPRYKISEPAFVYLNERKAQTQKRKENAMTDYQKLKDFMKGVEAGGTGQYDTGRDHFVELITLGFAGGPTVDEEAYDQGYEYGKSRAAAASGK